MLHGPRGIHFHVLARTSGETSTNRVKTARTIESARGRHCVLRVECPTKLASLESRTAVRGRTRQLRSQRAHGQALRAQRDCTTSHAQASNATEPTEHTESTAGLETWLGRFWHDPGQQGPRAPYPSPDEEV